jgi:hypothetical protein
LLLLVGGLFEFPQYFPVNVSRTNIGKGCLGNTLHLYTKPLLKTFKTALNSDYASIQTVRRLPVARVVCVQLQTAPMGHVVDGAELFRVVSSNVSVSVCL